jgi:hypothetical protein
MKRSIGAQWRATPRAMGFVCFAVCWCAGRGGAPYMYLRHFWRGTGDLRAVGPQTAHVSANSGGRRLFFNFTSEQKLWGIVARATVLPLLLAIVAIYRTPRPNSISLSFALRKLALRPSAAAAAAINVGARRDCRSLIAPWMGGTIRRLRALDDTINRRCGTRRAASS